VPEEIHNLRCANRTGIQTEIESPPRDSGNHREGFPVEMKSQLRGLAPRGPRTTHMRAFTQSAFVYKDDRSRFPAGFFLRAGHWYRFQRRIASSSRSIALPTGRWQLQPSSRSTRHTWPGWYLTPHSFSMISATRGNVHNPVSYPWACGPSCRIRSTRLRWRSSNRLWRPVRPAERRPRSPFFSSVFAHRDTDISLTSRCRATSACVHPLRSSAAAVRLRCSNALSAFRSRLTPFGFPIMHALSHRHA
jgi:hypothetical protein